MKRLLAVGLVFALLCAGCGIQPEPQRALDRMLNALTDGKISKAEKYMVQGFKEEYSTRRAKKLYQAMFHSLDYVVIKTTVEEDTAEIIVTVSMIDMATLVSDSSLSLLDQDLKGSLSQKRLYTLLRKKIKAGEINFVTSTVGVRMVRQNGDWLVNLADSSDFTNAITGGLGELIGY